MTDDTDFLYFISVIMLNEVNNKIVHKQKVAETEEEIRCVYDDIW